MSLTPSVSSLNFSRIESMVSCPNNTQVTPAKRPTVTKNILTTPQKEKKTIDYSNIKESNFSTFYMTNNNKEELSNSNSASDSVYIYYDSNNKLTTELIEETKPKLNQLISRTKVREYIEKSRNMYDFPSLCKYQEDHLAVPVQKWNDEKFKLQEMQLLKRPSSNQYKTSIKNMENPEKNKLKIDYLYNNLKKKKMIHSTKKQRVFFKKFYNEKREEYFPIFFDQDMGIFEYFQLPMIDTKVDDDCLTDEEQLFAAEKMCHKQMCEAVEIFSANGFNVINNSSKNEALSNKN